MRPILSDRCDNTNMGLFAARPEEPFEWAGIPSEPEGPRSDAELLETPPVDPFAISASSISITVDQPDAAPTGDDALSADDVDGSGPADTD